MSSESPSARVSLPLSAEGYAHANEAFRRCWTADREEVLAFFQQHIPAPHAGSLRVLGIGVGDGSFDLRMIAAMRAVMPDTAIEYVAVEPNEAQLARFAAQIEAAALSNVTFRLHAVRAEDYQISEPFDLIHFIHSLYHMPNSEEALIRHAVAGLRPGGRILAALSSEQGGIYQLMGRFWERIDYSFFSGGLFGQESLRALFGRLELPYAFELYPQVAIVVDACFEPGSVLGRHLLNFLLQADMDEAPPELRRDVLTALGELARREHGQRLLAHPSGVFAVAAPDA